MAGIFISYRRSDAEGWAGRFSDSLKGELGRVEIFRDIEDIPPGVEFDLYINDAVSNCDVLIALIGPNWLTVVDKNGARRIDDPSDFTRLEIVTALKRNVRVIPALVGGAKIPDMDELPDDLKPLVRRQSYELSDTRWQDDSKKLAGVLRPIVKRQSRLTTKAMKTIFVALLVLAAVSYGGKLWLDKKDGAVDAAKQAEIERQEKEKSAVEQAELERLKIEEAAAVQAELDRQEKERLAALQAEAERQRQEEDAARQAEAERREKESAAAEQAERERRIREAEDAKQAARDAARQAELERRQVARNALLERLQTLQKVSFAFPGDGTPNKNRRIGPFCCTGETAVVRDANKGRAGYIYFKDFKGGLLAGSGSSGATHLGILVSGRADLTDADSRQVEASIWFSAQELKRGKSRSARAGGLRFKATILDAKLEHSAKKGTYYIMDSVSVRVDVSVD